MAQGCARQAVIRSKQRFDWDSVQSLRRARLLDPAPVLCVEKRVHIAFLLCGVRPLYFVVPLHETAIGCPGDWYLQQHYGVARIQRRAKLQKIFLFGALGQLTFQVPAFRATGARDGFERPQLTGYDDSTSFARKSCLGIAEKTPFAVFLHASFTYSYVHFDSPRCVYLCWRIGKNNPTTKAGLLEDDLERN
jgi:hypothetical protein